VGEKDEPSPPAVETADPLPKLPQRWSRHANPELGFAIATYTAVVAANAKQGASAHRDEVLRSLRGRRAE
jgi:hypothetical protein